MVDRYLRERDHVKDKPLVDYETWKQGDVSMSPAQMMDAKRDTWAHTRRDAMHGGKLMHVLISKATGNAGGEQLEVFERPLVTKFTQNACKVSHLLTFWGIWIVHLGQKPIKNTSLLNRSL